MKLSTRFALPFVALFGLAALACGDSGDTIIAGNGGQQTGISVNGTGRATGVPDVVVLRLGVNLEASTVEAARDQAAKAQQAIIDSMKGNGVAEKDIQTEQFSIQPQYDFTGPGRVQTIRGYSVSNVLSVKVRNLNSTSKVLDDATRAGGNAVVVQGVGFTIDDPSELEAAARGLAVKDAHDRAEALAKYSGASLGKVISVSEYTQQPFAGDVIAPRAAAAQAPTDTPIQAGELTVVVNVSLIYAID